MKVLSEPTGFPSVFQSSYDIHDTVTVERSIIDRNPLGPDDGMKVIVI